MDKLVALGRVSKKTRLISDRIVFDLQTTMYHIRSQGPLNERTKLVCCSFHFMVFKIRITLFINK
jgi:hypothetical protein